MCRIPGRMWKKIIESRGEVHIDEIEVLTDRLRLRKFPRADFVSEYG